MIPTETLQKLREAAARVQATGDTALVGSECRDVAQGALALLDELERLRAEVVKLGTSIPQEAIDAINIGAVTEAIELRAQLTTAQSRIAELEARIVNDDSEYAMTEARVAELETEGERLLVKLGSSLDTSERIDREYQAQLATALRERDEFHEQVGAFIRQRDSAREERDAARAECERLRSSRRAADLTAFERMALRSHRDRLNANELEDRTLVAVLDKLLAAAEGK